MNEKVINIYTYLYKMSGCSKEELKELINVSSIKTVESYIRKLDDITYDIDLRKYKFIKLLPQYIPYDIYIEMIKDSISNNIIREDFRILEEALFKNKHKEMINTDNLSNLSKKIIQLKNAIKYNCSLKVSYKSAGKELEVKYINPHKVFSTGSSFYLYITYNELNENNVGKERTFALNSIGNIEIQNYIKNEVLYREQHGNAFGTFKKDKFVNLELDRISGDFFKREMLFSNKGFELIGEELDGDIVIVKMYYNNILEVSKIIQQWMPRIKIQSSSEIKQVVYNQISDNFKELLS